MGKASPIFMAFVLLLALANSGRKFFADARLAAELNVPFEHSEEIAIPLNLSGNSVAPRLEVQDVASPLNLSGNSVVPHLEVQGVASPLNLSGNSVAPDLEVQGVASPLNLSGNSVAPDLEVPVEDKLGKAIEEEWNAKIALGPGFVISNYLASPLQVHCWRAESDPEPHRHSLFNTTVMPQQQESWDLSVIDPKTKHNVYRCSMGFTDPLHPDSTQCVVQVVWADHYHWMCPHCDFKVLADGIYMQKITPYNPFTKVQGWSDC